MMKLVKPLLLMSILVSAWPLGALGSREVEPRMTEVEGVVRLVGNEPFTRLAVTAKDGKSYFFEADKRKTYSRFMGLLVTVRGKLEEKELKTADGKALGIEYLIKDAEVKAAGPNETKK